MTTSRSELVHRVSNGSACDDTGRLTRFKVKTCCGLSLEKPRLVTDRPQHVTCRRCIMSMAVWGGANDRRADLLVGV